MSSDPEARLFKTKREWRAEKLRQYNESEAAREREARERAERVAVDIVSPDSLTPVGFLEDTREPLPQGRLSHRQERLWRHVYEGVADVVAGLSQASRPKTPPEQLFPSTGVALAVLIKYRVDGYPMKSLSDPGRLEYQIRAAGTNSQGDRAQRLAERLAEVDKAWRLAFDGPWDGGRQGVLEEDCRAWTLLRYVVGWPLKHREDTPGMDIVTWARREQRLAVSAKLVGRVTRHGLDVMQGYLSSRDIVPGKKEDREVETVAVDSESDLFGWKEIADFLGVHENTARRWAREMGMPVRRFDKRREASREELRQWRLELTELPGS